MTVTLAGAAPRRWSLPSWRRLADLLARHPELVTAVLAAVVLATGQRGPDLPAQAYRVFLFRHHGLLAFDTHWYAGHPLPGYSLVFPPLAGVLGARLVGALSCVAAAAVFPRLLRGPAPRGHDVAAVWFAVVVVVNLVVGRLPFVLGFALGLGALVAARDRRPWPAAGLAAASSAASPLAGAFLLLAAGAWALAGRQRRPLPLAAAAVGIAAAGAFGEGGWFPFPWTTLLIVELLSVGGLVVVPRGRTLTRTGLALYGASSAVLFAFHNPVGGNMVRLGAVAGGPLIAYELLRARRRLLLAVAAVPLLLWGFAPLPAAFAASRDNPSAHAGYYTGLLGYLSAHGGTTARLEVPLTNGRWESDYLAAQVPLARGWERQLDRGQNEVLYDPHLTAAAYHRWLRANAVSWVALPDVPLDESETGEAALLTGPPLPFLREVWSDRHWVLWRVSDARPLVRGPATLRRLGLSSVSIAASRPGRVTVLVRWTRFWAVTAGSACIGPTRDGWTAIDVAAAGEITLTAKVGLGTLAGAGRDGACYPRAPGRS